MVQAYDEKLVIIEVGHNVLVNIPKLVRGPLNIQNIIFKTPCK